jgi:hypothetical protein
MYGANRTGADDVAVALRLTLEGTRNYGLRRQLRPKELPQSYPTRRHGRGGFAEKGLDRFRLLKLLTFDFLQEPEIAKLEQVGIVLGLAVVASFTNNSRQYASAPGAPGAIGASYFSSASSRLPCRFNWRASKKVFRAAIVFSSISVWERT